MDSRLTLKQRKRSFLTWLLIFIMVFNSLPLDVFAANYRIEDYLNEYGNEFTRSGMLVSVGDVISWNCADEGARVEYYVGSNRQPADIGYSGTNATHIVKSPEALGFSIDNSKLYAWEIESVSLSGGVQSITFRAILNCTVSFNANGHGSDPASQTVSQGSTVTEPPMDEPTGISFGGWYKEAACTNAWDFADPVNNDMTLYAKWSTASYNIAYELDGGTNAAGNPAEYTYGVGVASLADPTKDNYDFAGWYTDPGKNNPVGYPVISTTDTGDKTFYAKWTACSYDIIYELDGGENDPDNPARYQYGVGVSSLKAPNKTGHHFDGWYTDSGKSNPVSNPVISTTASGNKTFYAKWTPETYEISYDLDGGTLTTPNPDTYTYGVGVAALNQPTKTEHRFDGWFTDSGKSNPVSNPVISTTDTGDKSFYAKFTPNTYDITYHLDGGTNASSNPSSYTYGVGVASLANATKEGNRFDGWYRDSAFNTLVSGIAISANSTGTKEFWAKFTPIDYNIYYVLDGGTNANSNPDGYIYGVGVATLADPSKEGYTFDGWYTNAAKTVPVNNPVISTTDTGDKTFYAKWTINRYTVTWNNYDGTNLDTEEYDYGATPTYKKAVPTKDPTPDKTYTHDGWTPAIKPVSENTVYTAKFAESDRKFTITWKNDDGTVLRTDKVVYGEMPDYGGTPTKASTDQYSYTFNGWTPAVVAVTDDATYTATYKATLRTYTVTWKNCDGTVLETDRNVPYGTMPSYGGATPVHPEDDGQSYEFTGWSPEPSAVKADATYYATYSNMAKYYTVTFVDDDGTTVLKGPDTYAYGTNASDIVRPADPVKAFTEQYSYEFAGWTPAIADVTADAVYKAEYIETLRVYEVIWQNDDGTVLEKDTAAYGTMPEYNGDTPTKKSDDKYSYSFTGWTPDIVRVTKDAVYTAVYDSEEIDNTRKYLIKFVDSDGVTVLKEAVEYDYGTPASAIKQPSTPYKAPDDQYEYSFAGWSPALARVTKDQTYRAVYNTKPRETKEPEPKDEDTPEPPKPAAVPTVTTVNPATAVKSPQTGEDNRRMILIGASAFSISVLLLGTLLKRKRK